MLDLTAFKGPPRSFCTRNSFNVKRNQLAIGWGNDYHCDIVQPQFFSGQPSRAENVGKDFTVDFSCHLTLERGSHGWYNGKEQEKKAEGVDILIFCLTLSFHYQTQDQLQQK